MALRLGWAELVGFLFSAMASPCVAPHPQRNTAKKQSGKQAEEVAYEFRHCSSLAIYLMGCGFLYSICTIYMCKWVLLTPYAFFGGRVVISTLQLFPYKPFSRGGGSTMISTGVYEVIAGMKRTAQLNSEFLDPPWDQPWPVPSILTNDKQYY